MSVIIAIKHEGVVYLGSHGSLFINGFHCRTTNLNNIKIWQVPESNNAIMGSPYFSRPITIIHTIPLVPADLESLTQNYIVTIIVPKIMEELKNYSALSPENPKELEEGMFIAYKDKVFLIDFDLNVREIEDYYAIGSECEIALGGLFETKDSSLLPEERMERALRVTSRVGSKSLPTYVMMNTQDPTLKIVEE